MDAKQDKVREVGAGTCESRLALQRFYATSAESCQRFLWQGLLIFIMKIFYKKKCKTGKMDTLDVVHYLPNNYFSTSFC